MSTNGGCSLSLREHRRRDTSAEEREQPSSTRSSEERAAVWGLKIVRMQIEQF